MELDLTTLVGLTGASASAIALLLGYLSERSWLGALMLAAGTFIACGLCFAGTALAGGAGLVIAVLLVTLLGYFIGRSLGRERGAVFVPLLWLGFVGFCVVGYSAGRGLGLLTITLPSLAIFWVAMYRVSRTLLPEDQAGRPKPFRCLVSFCLGTNRPYHVLEGPELVQRVAGNPYGQFFAGPGIVLTDPAHAPIIWDGVKFRRIGEPGLTFTERLETVYQTVDLRPQYRTCQIEAICRDGIRIRVDTFMAFRLQAAGREPTFGSSFPREDNSIFRAVWRQPVEDGQKRSWDELVPIVATRLLRRIIGRYRFDDLCEPFDPGKNPRAEVQGKLISQLRRNLRTCGLEIVDVWLGNLEPADSSIIEERTMAWRAEWERKILVTQGQARANAVAEVERAYTQAQAELISAITQVVELRPDMNPEVLTNLAALRFVEALEDITTSAAVQLAVPAKTAETLEYLRRAMKVDTS